MTNQRDLVTFQCYRNKVQEASKYFGKKILPFVWKKFHANFLKSNGLNRMGVNSLEKRRIKKLRKLDILLDRKIVNRKRIKKSIELLEIEENAECSSDENYSEEIENSESESDTPENLEISADVKMEPIPSSDNGSEDYSDENESQYEITSNIKQSSENNIARDQIVRIIPQIYFVI